MATPLLRRPALSILLRCKSSLSESPAGHRTALEARGAGAARWRTRRIARHGFSTDTAPKRHLTPKPSRRFDVVVICALPLEADAVEALFDSRWDVDRPTLKAGGDPNAYTAGTIGHHNVVLAHMAGMGKANAAMVAATCRTSFPDIKLCLLVGICGAAPFSPDGEEIILGDVIVGDGVIQHDFGSRLPDRFVRKNTILDSLGRPNVEIRTVLAKLKALRSRELLATNMATHIDLLRLQPELAADYPGVKKDFLFESSYRHAEKSQSCEQAGCSGTLVSRRRLQPAHGNPSPRVHFGLFASGDSVFKSGEDRDSLVQSENVIAFEMEAAGIWDSFPCLVVKSACDYADSHKNQGWQRYAAATAAACAKAILNLWPPYLSRETEVVPDELPGPRFLTPYPENQAFVGRSDILEALRRCLLTSGSSMVAVVGLGGVGKTQVALAFIYSLRESHPDISVFWVHAGSAARFRQAYLSIAQECGMTGWDDPNADVLALVKTWLERQHHGRWLMVVDNADDETIFYSSQDDAPGGYAQYIPECPNGYVLLTTRNKRVGVAVTKGGPVIEVLGMNQEESGQLIRKMLRETKATDEDVWLLSARLEGLPLALVQAAAYIRMNSMDVRAYLRLLDRSDRNMVELLGKEFQTVGRDSKAPQAVAATWMISMKQIEDQKPLAGELLALMSCFERQAIPRECLQLYVKHYWNEASANSKVPPESPKTSEIDLEEALGILKAFSFISGGNDDSITMHRLVHLITERWLITKDSGPLYWKRTLLILNQLFPADREAYSSRGHAYLPHAQAAIFRLETAAELATYTEEESMTLLLLYRKVANYLFDQGRNIEAKSLNLLAWDALEQLLGVEHPETLRCMIDLSAVLGALHQGKQAETLQRRALEVQRRLLGDDHPNTLTTASELVISLIRLGSLTEAQALLEKNLEILRRTRDENHPLTLDSKRVLSTLLLLRGQPHEAESLISDVLERSRQELGEGHVNTQTALVSMGSVYLHQGRFKEAEEIFWGVGVTLLEEQGLTHPFTLFCFDKLVSTLSAQKRWKEAEEVIKIEIQALRKSPGAVRPTLTYWALLQARLWLDQGKLDEGEGTLAGIFRASRDLAGAEDLSTLVAMHWLAIAVKMQGRDEEAVSLMTECVDIHKRVLGEDDECTKRSAWWLEQWSQAAVEGTKSVK